MNCNKRKIILFFCFYLFLFTGNIFAQNNQSGSSLTDQDISSLRPKIEFDAQGARNPFKDYITPEVISIGEEIKVEEIKGNEEVQVFNPPSLTVQGIVWGGAAPCAIIDGEVKKEGDSVGKVKVLVIKREGLELLYEGKKYSLPSVFAAPKAK